MTVPIQKCQHHGTFTAFPNPRSQHVIGIWHFRRRNVNLTVRLRHYHTRIATCHRNMTYSSSQCQYHNMSTAPQPREMQHYRGIPRSIIDRKRHGHTIDPEALHIIPKWTCPQCKLDANKPIEQNTYQHKSQMPRYSNSNSNPISNWNDEMMKWWNCNDEVL